LPERALYDSWPEVMAALEAANADALDATTRSAWSPPVGLGVLPEELLVRAERLLAAQRVSIAELADAQRSTARHLAAVRTVPTRGDDQSVYLDVRG